MITDTNADCWVVGSGKDMYHSAQRQDIMTDASMVIRAIRLYSMRDLNQLIISYQRTLWQNEHRKMQQQ